MDRSNTPRGPMTTAIHAGEAPDPATGASAPPIHMSSSFVSDDISGFSAHDIQDHSPYSYARWANPTTDMLDAKSPHCRVPMPAFAWLRAWRRQQPSS